MIKRARGGRDDGEISQLTAEYHDPLLEGRYWRESQEDLAHWGATASLLCGAFALPLALADLANVGFGAQFLGLAALRALSAVVAFGLHRQLRSDPSAVRRHGHIAACSGLLLACFAAIALLQPDTARLDHLEIGLVVLAVFVVVPNRIPYTLGTVGIASALWVALSAVVRDTPDSAVLAQALGFAVTIAIGWAAAVLLGTSRRREYSVRIGAELANERLRAEIARRERLETDLVQKANTDPLTQVANRRHFEEQARDEFLRCQRTHQPLSLMVLDVDHFKWINDTHGHAAGDEVLRVLSDALAEQVRRIDVVGRLGGEEFAVVMPGAELARAEEAAERLRARVASIRVELPTGMVRLTVSIGVTECEVWTEQIADALGRADEAMYRAKTSGRDRVVLMTAGPRVS